MSPLVSVCILTFNSQAFIVEAIESAMRQTLQDIEIVIVDNCSNDSTFYICNELKNKDSRITLHKNEIPLGISGGLNSCLKRASGQYIKFLMHDDILAPDCLEKMVAAFQQFPTVTVVACSEYLITAEGEHIESLMPSAETGLVNGRKIAKEILYKMSNILGTPSSILMKRDDYGNGFDRSLFLFEDADIYLRALLKGDLYFINEPLSKVRRHERTGSSINSNTLIFISDMLQLKETYTDFMTEEGIPALQWSKIVEERILAYVGHMMQEGVTGESAKKYASKLKGLVGHDYVDQLLESMVGTIFHGYSQLFRTNLEARFNEKENARLTEEIRLMSNSLPFRISQPLRNLKTRLFNIGKT